MKRLFISVIVARLILAIVAPAADDAGLDIVSERYGIAFRVPADFELLLADDTVLMQFPEHGVSLRVVAVDEVSVGLAGMPAALIEGYVVEEEAERALGAMRGRYYRLRNKYAAAGIDGMAVFLGSSLDRRVAIAVRWADSAGRDTALRILESARLATTAGQGVTLETVLQQVVWERKQILVLGKRYHAARKAVGELRYRDAVRECHAALETVSDRPFRTDAFRAAVEQLRRLQRECEERALLGAEWLTSGDGASFGSSRRKLKEQQIKDVVARYGVELKPSAADERETMRRSGANDAQTVRIELAGPPDNLAGLRMVATLPKNDLAATIDNTALMLDVMNALVPGLRPHARWLADSCSVENKAAGQPNAERRAGGLIFRARWFSALELLEVRVTGEGGETDADAIQDD